jgi:mRNA-degrading endonuclease RelE of RelBE toxin-antitoxin system
MASYSVVTIASADKQIRAAPFPFRRRIVHALVKLKSQPRPPGSHPIEDDVYRLVLDGWRIVYLIGDDDFVVTVLRVLAPSTSP